MCRVWVQCIDQLPTDVFRTDPILVVRHHHDSNAAIVAVRDEGLMTVEDVPILSEVSNSVGGVPELPEKRHRTILPEATIGAIAVFRLPQQGLNRQEVAGGSRAVHLICEPLASLCVLKTQ